MSNKNIENLTINDHNLLFLRLKSVWNGKKYLNISNFNIVQAIENAERSKEDIITPKEAEIELKKIKDYGANLITINSEYYPKELLKIQNPPLILYGYGNIELLKRSIFSIIGSRLATSDSLKLSYNFAQDISNFGLTIASGFANGVDTAVCNGALKSGTIQVLGCGVDVVYPSENKKLYNDVIKNNGLFISEIKMGSEPQARYFPSRNRIISGMSLGTLLVQAGYRNGSSGSMLTAKMALDQGKYLFAIPGNPMDARFEGCNSLIKFGDAIFTTKPSDITDMLGYTSKNLNLFDETVNESSVANEITLDFDNEFHNDNYDIHDIKEKVMSIVSEVGTTIDDIASICNVDISIISSCLTELELNGKISIRYDGTVVC